MPKNSLHSDPVWERQIALLGPDLDERARLLRELCAEITMRESQVAALAEKGLHNGQIAERLGISPATVDNHASHARHKVALPSDITFRKLITFVVERAAKNKNKLPEENDEKNDDFSVR